MYVGTIFKKDNKFKKIYVIKPSSELSNKKVIYTSNFKKVNDYLKFKDDFLVQDYIDGHQYNLVLRNHL